MTAGSAVARFDTQLIAPRELLAFWNDFVCQNLLGASCDIPAPESFQARMSLATVGELQIGHVQASGFQLQRTRSHIQHAREEYMVLMAQHAGFNETRQCGESVALAAGSIGMYEGDEPSDLQFSDQFAQSVLLIPRRALTAALPELQQRTTARPLPAAHPATTMLLSMVGSLHRSAAPLNPAAAQHVQQALVQTIAAALAASDNEQPDVESLPDYQRARIRAYARAHLSDVNLTVAQVARAAGLSAGHVHRLFADQPLSLMKWLWHERLLAAQQALLAGPEGPKGIAEIAFRHGFQDPAHFSRRFRQSFGCSPSAWQAAQAARRATPATWR